MTNILKKLFGCSNNEGTFLALKRGHTEQRLRYTGNPGEVIVDLDKHTLYLQDGKTKGGHPIKGIRLKKKNDPLLDPLVRIDLSAVIGVKKEKCHDGSSHYFYVSLTDESEDRLLDYLQERKLKRNSN